MDSILPLQEGNGLKFGTFSRPLGGFCEASLKEGTPLRLKLLEAEVLVDDPKLNLGKIPNTEGA